MHAAGGLASNQQSHSTTVETIGSLPMRRLAVNIAKDVDIHTTPKKQVDTLIFGL